MKLVNCCQNYGWGSTDGLVREIVEECQGKTEDQPYAEYWMGTHKNGPSKVADGTLLSEVVGAELPFLLKVLSVAKPLSIQVHPDKETAEKLFEENSAVYKDPNDKPELFICLSETFDLFFGFVPVEEAVEAVVHFKKAFEEALGEEKVGCFLENKQKSSYFAFYCDIVRLEEDKLETLTKRVIEEKSGFDREDNINRVNDSFPGDKGVVFALFMNLLTVKEGDSLFIGAGVPHAYLKGDCVECMINSDNTVRLGCTPKLVDKPTYLRIIEKIGDSLVEGGVEYLGQKEGNCTVYQGTNRFKVTRVQVEGEYTHFSEGPQIAFVLKGEGTLNDTKIARFDSFYLKKEQKHVFEGQFELFIASY